MIWGHKVIVTARMEGRTKQMTSRAPRQVPGGIWLGQGLKTTALKLGGGVVKWARGHLGTTPSFVHFSLSVKSFDLSELRAP